MMISASDVLQIINEIHQYSMLFIELKDATTIGILHFAGDHTSYFKLEQKLGPDERSTLTQAIYSGQTPDVVKTMTLEDFLSEIEGKKAKHIWLESGAGRPREHGFMSISELKAFFRNQSVK
jgi:hypothetical protein